MRFHRPRIFTTLAFACVAIIAAGVHAQTQPSSSISIVEAGKALDGTQPRYNVEVFGADLGEVLGALLRKSGSEFSIDQDVSGPITLLVRDATLSQVLDRVKALARPPIDIKQGKVIRVSLMAPPTGQMGQQRQAGFALQNMNSQQARNMLNQVAGQNAGISPLAAFPQQVTLDIAEARPARLADALKQIERQTSVPIRLDPRVPRDIGFCAQFTQTPLSLVLDAISRTGAFKWQLMPDGSVMVGPSDWLRVQGGTLMAGYPTRPCPQCGRAALPGWTYCPYDGRPLARTASPSRRP